MRFWSNKYPVTEDKFFLISNKEACDVCKCDVPKLYKCDNCRHRTICKKCVKNDVCLCTKCCVEYDEWAKKIEKAAIIAKSERKSKNNNYVLV